MSEATHLNIAGGQGSGGAEGQILHPRSLIAFALFLASLMLYLATLAPSVVTIFDDSLEFQLVTYQLGIAHPTGYPLYTLLGKLFTLVPLGNVAYRVNLLSAVFGAATVALLYLLILAVVAPRAGAKISLRQPAWPTHLGAVIGAALFGLGQVFWQQATVAEVYTLNAFFVALVLLLATLLPALSPRQQSRGILWLAFVYGLSLTHHRTMLLILPALLLHLLFFFRTVIFKPRVVVWSVALGLLPLLLYLYLPLRGHVGSLDGSYHHSWAGFWRQVSASGYGLFIFENPFGHDRDLAFYWSLLADQFYTTVPGLIGLLYLVRLGQPKMLLLTGLAALSYLTFNLFYRVTDIEVFFIPIFLLWAVWSGLGAAFLLHTFAAFKYTAWRPVILTVLLAVFAMMSWQLFQTGRAALRSQSKWQVHDYGLDILAQSLPADNSAVVGILGEMTLLRYFQQTEQRRPDIQTVAADLETDRLAAVADLLAQGKAVYLTRPLPGAPARWSLAAVGPLIRVMPEPATIPPEFAVAVDQVVIPEVTLLGYNLARPPHTGAGPAPLRLTLFWQVNQPIAVDLKISARLLDLAGAPVAVVDGAPVHFAYPTTAWRPGEIIADAYDLALPVNLPPGLYTPLLIWYDPAQNAAEVGRIELAPVTIEFGD